MRARGEPIDFGPQRSKDRDLLTPRVRPWRARACLVACALLGVTPVSATPGPKARPPSAPAIAAGNRTFVAFVGQPAPVRLAWSPVSGATRYRARWTDSGAHIDVELPGTATAFERSESTPGHHQLSVVAIDANGLESPPTQVAIDVVTVVGIAPGADEPSAPSSGAFAIGARFSSPGLRCQLGAGELADQVFATRAGASVLRCGGEAGQPKIEVPVVITPVIVSAEVAPVRRETPTRIHISVASVAPIGDHLDVEAIGDLDLGDAERTAGGLDVPITAAAGSANAGLVIRAGTVELGRFDLALVDAAPAVAGSSTDSAWFALDLGARIGAFMTPQDGRGATFLGKPTDPNDTLASGPFAGLSVGLFPLRRIGLEVQAAIATPSYTGRFGVAAMLLTRAQIAARLVDDQSYGLRLLVGGDILGVLTEAGTSHRSAIGGVHYGVAFTVETRPNVSVRFEALHVITVAQDAGYAHCLEVSVGVVTRLGRRDRWR
jgi:hypothetical protein